MNDQRPLTKPDVRVTIIGETLTIAPWVPLLAPKPDALADGKPRAILDLEYLGEVGSREILVRGDVTNPIADDARRVLLSWARIVGLNRVWLVDEVIDLPGEVPAEHVATVTCLTCLSEFSYGGMTFWEGVSNFGVFPTGCRVCGSTLPQWSIAD